LRNPVKDNIAIVGVGTSEYSRDAGDRSVGALALDACRRAIDDSGLTRHDIDGVVSTGHVGPAYLQRSLGVDVSWFDEAGGPVTWALGAAINALHAGCCEVALVSHAVYRTAANSRSASRDPFRASRSAGPPDVDVTKAIRGPRSAAAWASRYLLDFNASRKDFGRFAINSRSNAGRNPHAVLRQPMTIDDYLASRQVYDPLCVLDMDLPIDGADAFVLTTADRARDVTDPVFIHATAFGRSAVGDYREQNAGLQETGSDRVMRVLWAKSDLSLADVDVFFPYDGFTVYGLLWIEAAGYCGRGEAGQFIRDCWNEESDRIELGGRILFNPHGGSLSEGATQGAGHLREAVDQLRGRAGSRQVPQCRVGLVTPGGAFHNASAVMLTKGTS
jgi:acetyl-CoA acetyltransferase